MSPISFIYSYIKSDKNHNLNITSCFLYFSKSSIYLRIEIVKY